jgi:hypothetical protein
VFAARFRQTRSTEERLAAFRRRPILFAVGEPPTGGTPTAGQVAAAAVTRDQTPWRTDAGDGLAPCGAGEVGSGRTAAPTAPAPEAFIAPGTLNQRTRPQGVAVAARVMALVGDVAAGVMLSQLIYWTRRGPNVVEHGGWIFKSAKDWQRETGMTWKVQRRARALLVGLGFIEERLQTMPARLEFRLQVNRLCQQLAERSGVAIEPVGLDSFCDRNNLLVNRLLGRAYLYQPRLAECFASVHTVMLASRLLSALRPGDGWGGVRDPLAAAEPARPSTDAPSRDDAGRARPDRLVRMHRADWLRETGLSRDQWQTARRKLRDAGVLIEVHRNFPRRIDLGVRVPLLAALLAARRSRAGDDGAAQVMTTCRPLAVQSESPARLEAGLDRAKQLGGIGLCAPMDRQAVPVWPDPADSDEPIPPIAIARSNLYLNTQLQKPLHPQQDTHGRPTVRGWRVFGCGGGGSDEAEYRNAAIGVRVRDAGPAAATLVWPAVFVAEDRPPAMDHLRGLASPLQQTLLDEIEWQHAQRPVRSPIALLRVLSSQAREGQFVPDGAHRIAARRRDRTVKAEVVAAPAADEPLTEEAAAAKEQLRAIAHRLRIRRSA